MIAAFPVHIRNEHWLLLLYLSYVWQCNVTIPYTPFPRSRYVPCTLLRPSRGYSDGFPDNENITIEYAHLDYLFYITVCIEQESRCV